MSNRAVSMVGSLYVLHEFGWIPHRRPTFNGMALPYEAMASTEQAITPF